jgi:serine/threonine-protein kinase
MRAGELLVDRYELGDRLGVGGMSTVVSAHDRRLERDVAVKLLAEHLADDHQFVERFRREALAAARLVHPNIVQVFDFGLDEKSHRQYIVMELVSGQSGAEILKEEGRMDLRDALSMVTQACAGLEYAHRNGVVHRDVKPGNLLRSGEGVVKLADFGIAKAMSDESAITQIGSVLGTAAYLAPEQAAGESAGPSADIYALGVVTYQLMSGRLPYEANSLTELALMQQREMPPALHEIAPGISPQLSAAVDRALALDPNERFASADEMRAALEAGAAGKADPTHPATSATRVATAGDDDATTVLGGTAATAAAGPVAAREPRQPRAPRSAPPPVAAPQPRRSRERAAAPARRKPRSGFRQTMGMFLILVLLAAGGAAAVIATSGSTDAVNLRRVVYDNVQQGVDAVKGLVQDNTR